MKFKWEMKGDLGSLEWDPWNSTLISERKITLVNVLHVPHMNKDLVRGDLLVKLGIKYANEPGKLTLTRNGVFVEKEYFAEGMIKLCITDNTINKKFNSTYA